MLDRILFWAVLVWMVGMLAMAFVAVREVWRDSNRPVDEDPDGPPAGKSPPPPSGKSPDV